VFNLHCFSALDTMYDTHTHTHAHTLEGKSMSTILNDVIDMEKVQEGKFTLNMVRLNGVKTPLYSTYLIRYCVYTHSHSQH
jgi:hypothetical protein